MLAENYAGVRPAPGYPAQPDHTEKATLFRILDATARKLGIAPEKVIVTVDRHANTSAASVPLALDVALARRGQQLGLAGLRAFARAVYLQVIDQDFLEKKGNARVLPDKESSCSGASVPLPCFFRC